MKNTMNIKSIVLISILLLMLGCQSKHLVLEKNNPLYIQQDVSVLKEKNGTIVEQEIIDVDNQFKGEVECYKIKYLSDALEVVGYIVKPKYIASKLPVLIFNRGGNREFGKISEKKLKYLSYLATNKYVVIASQYRGNDGGQGQEEFGGKDVNDILNLMPLARSLTFADSNNIVMLGFSRGGMMAYLAIKEGIDIKAAAVVGGITDLIQWDQEREHIGEKVLEQLIWPINQEEYMKRSAYYWPEKINVPLLILHGEDDWRVKVSQAEKLSTKLKEAGKTHELVVFPNGDHGLNAHRPKRNKMIFDWFDNYLKK